MRAAAVTLLLLVPAAARADDRAAGWVSVYSDSDDLTVVSPQAEARVDATDAVELIAAVDIDVISAATVDVMTAASPRGYHEVRQGGSLGAAWRPRADTLLAAGALVSWETDYRSLGATATASREWIDRRLTTRIDGRLLVDRVGRAGDDPSRWRDLVTPSVSLGTAWIFDPATIGELTWELQAASGFQASPYRYVAIAWPDGGAMVPEAVPDLRVRNALAARVRRALPGHWFAGGGYRFYADDWSVYGHTGDLELQRAFAGDRLIAGVTGRAHWQGAAGFYRADYQTEAGMLPALRTSDKTLAESWSILGGIRLEAAAPRSGPVDSLRALVKAEVYDQHFHDFPALRRRTALILSLAITAEY